MTDKDWQIEALLEINQKLRIALDLAHHILTIQLPGFYPGSTVEEKIKTAKGLK